MKKVLLFCAMALMISISAIAGINEKLSASTQLFIAERDGKISLDMKVAGPTQPSRAPLLRTRPVERLIAPAERINGIDMVSAFIHVDPNRTAKLESMGVEIQERFNGFVTAMIPVDIIEKVAELPEVLEVNVARKVAIKTDRARYYTNTDDVLNYTSDAIAAGLPQAFKGTGVVVGVIDDGIDFQHTMFKDANGNTRIKRAYIARGAGSFTTYTNITSSSPTTDDSGESHGTHTSSTAAGSEITVGTTVYGGMAPESSLVLVGCGSYLYNTNIANGIKYIFDYADSQNMPAVCSISLGTHNGPHDGTGELASTYAQYAGNNPNHIIVCAAGNEAGGDYGMQYSGGTASSSTPFSTVLNGCYYPYNGYGTTYLNRMYQGYDVFYARTANKTLACKLHVVNTSDNSVVWTSNAITSSTSSVSGITTYFDRSPQVTISRNSYNSKYYVQLSFNQMSKKSAYTDRKYALAVSVYPTSGSCVIDGWDVSGYNAFGTMSGTYGGYTFVAGSDDCSICDECASDNVISVGAYASKRTVKDYNGSSHSLSFTLNDIAYFSSYQAAGSGPTGVAKPDICAPGATIVAGINHYDNTYMNNEWADYGMYLVYNNGASSLGNMDGTSMSTPCAAGIIALYLQAAKYAGKTLNTAAVRDVFANTAIHDSYTSKKNFGPNGKINALEGIKYILGEAGLPQPQLTVSPESLTFTANVGETVTKTFTVTGTDLLGDVTLSLSGSAVYSISPTTITPAEAAEGKTVTVTYTPTVSGTQTGTVTLSTISIDSKTVSLTGTATRVPTLNVNPAELSFNAEVGQSVTQTFVVSGTNLTSGTSVQLSVGGENSSMFTIDKTNLTRTAVQNGATVTVTYRPTTGGTHNAVVTISGGGAAEAKTVTLTGVAPEPVRTITVNPTSLSFNATTGQNVTKTFTVTGTNLSGNLSLSLSNGNGIYRIDKTSITASAAAAGAVVTVTYSPTVAGTSNATVTVSGGGAEAVTVALSGTAELLKSVPVMLPADEAFITSTSFRADWTDETPEANVVSYTLEVNTVTSLKLANNLPIAGATARFTAVSPMFRAGETGDGSYRLITGITPDKFYVVNDLFAGGTFVYRVKAVYADGTESDWSNTQEVTLLEPGHGYAPGDVNHDNSVNITDVTLLISNAMGTDNGICTTCADVNGDGVVNISDVTILINMVNSETAKIQRRSNSIRF